MMKKWISTLLVLLLCLALAVPAFARSATEASQYVSDQADLLSQKEETVLADKLIRLSKESDAQIMVVTLPSIGNHNIDDYIEDFYDSHALGFGSDRSGVLLLVSMEPREVAILSNGAAHDAIGDGEIGKILDAITGDLSDGDYADAFDAFADKCEYYLDGHINGFPFKLVQNLLIASVIGLVAGLITAFCLKAQLKSIRRQNQADAYVKPGSMHLTVRRDMFLYRRITRTKKQSSNSSGSRSGSSRSVGSRSF